jgi:hypothetical protein
MATIKINGVTLDPQPARAKWDDNLIDQKLNATDALGTYRLFTIHAPPLAGQADFNWTDFQNQVLTSIQAFAPGDRPTGANVVYSSGAVARQIKTYESGDDRAVGGVMMEIWVVVQ